MKDTLSELKQKSEVLAKKEKMCESFQKKIGDILNEKQCFLDHIEELESELLAIKDKHKELNMINERTNSELTEKLRARDLAVVHLTEDMKQIRSTGRTQENTISYFRKKVEEITRQLDEEKREKINIQSEMRRREHVSSRP